MWDLHRHHPNFLSTVADQDVLNWARAQHPEDYGLMPCGWMCDWTCHPLSHRRGPDPGAALHPPADAGMAPDGRDPVAALPQLYNCTTCSDPQIQCHAYHFVKRSYLNPQRTFAEGLFEYFNDMPPSTVAQEKAKHCAFCGQTEVTG